MTNEQAADKSGPIRGTLTITHKDRSVTLPFNASKAEQAAAIEALYIELGSLSFLQRLSKGGSIISSNDCSVVQIAWARACRRFFVDEFGYGYVYFPALKG